MGRKPRRLRDWLFGSTAKRLLLAALLREPTRTWTKRALAQEARVHEKGGLDEHLLALVQMRLVARMDGGYRLASDSPLVTPLAALLTALEAVPDEDVGSPA